MSDDPATEIRDDEWAIDVAHVTKRFRLQDASRSLKTAAIDLLRRRAPQTFTALDDVSLRVKHGETVGIVGANGAGKSTLLSIIAGTLRATSGTARTRGTVSSLLELGAGFHPDLTGRENVMLYGAIMGIPRETMRRRFDKVVDFAGLEEFIDQPVRFYSSGMYVRLGFSVAVQVDPDVLLVDEVLAVGDADFQRKCLAKMDEFRGRGKSMLLISHDLHTVRRIADRVAYLARGRMLGVGDPLLVSERYMKDSVLEADAALAKHEWGTGEAKFTRAAHLDPATGREIEGTFECTDDRPAFRLHWHADRRLDDPVVGFSIADTVSGRNVFGSNTQIAGFRIGPIEKGDGSIELRIDASNLQAGEYLLSFSLHSGDHKTNYHRLEHGLQLRVKNRKWFDGLVSLPVQWSK